ncbi:cytochrome b [Govanella unica]|uniref:Cytochrome b n=1 Tax=Govanella unica TaxID=2975056 RepID=A0A9X3TXC5_9PROT|nr:cytochrome b/b6 [Govania unica]MDA5193403.1 cytochrome b/b6 [Govania unica]
MASSNYEPKNPVLRAFNQQLPILSLVHGSLGAGYRAPKNLNYFWNFGSLAGVCLVVQILTGIILAMHYTPHTTLAFSSVEHIMRDVNYGWLLRYVHANGASMFFVVVYVHIFRGLYYGSYRSPRETLWFLGIIIYLLMMATGFMGYVLPWGQMSFWGATVITNLFSAFPVVGESIVQLLWGGFAVDNPTLNRFFSLHYLLPFVIAGVVVLHIWALHIPGSNNPLGIDVKGKQDTVPFYPYYISKDALGLGVFLLVFAFFVFFAPNFLGHPDNYIPANPMVTPTHIVPEWYYLPFYAILRAIPDKLMGVIAMFASILILFAMPWLDGSSARSSKFRPLYRFFLFLFLAVALFLGYCGSKSPDDVLHLAGLDIPFLLLSRIASFYYFAFFLLIVPIVSRREVPLPLPKSINDYVLGNKAKSAS